MIPSIVVFIRRNTCSFVCKHARRAKSRTQCFIVSLVVIIFIIFYGFPHKRIHLQPVTRKNLQQYCNFPVNANGMEGELDRKEFKLQSVQVLIRHGDRSPIHNLEGIHKIKLDCSMKPSDKTLKTLFDGYLGSLEYLKSRKLSPKTLNHMLSSVHHVCKYNGQLTQRGFQQLMEIGKYLRNVYPDLEVNHRNNIYARSTNYDRTAQTTAALLYGFLGEEVGNIGQISINVTKDTYFREGDSSLLKSCPASKKTVMESRLSVEYREGMKAMEPFMQGMADMLVMPRKSLPTVSFIADFSFAHFCHGFAYPCARNGCFNEQTALKMVSYADWYFYNKYKHVSDMLSLPVLTQIGSRMLSRTQSQSPITLAIYGGHESSLIPVLQSLGTYNRRWIPYASRIVFELWSKVAHSETSSSRNFLRVLFNGESVTHKLVFCKGKAVQNGELCPLEAFLDWLGGGRFENAHKRYDYLCNQ